jgi:fructokinase
MCPVERYALVVGEALVDVVRRPDGTTQEHPGGSAANVALALARLGRPVRFLTALGDDARGRLVAAHLRESGVELAGDPFVLERTSTAQATIGADGAATYEFDFEWRLDDLPDEDPAFLHVCSLGAVVRPGADAVREVVERHRGRAVVSYDVNARPMLTGTGADVVDRVNALARLSHVVKASDEDLAALFPDEPPEIAAERMRGLGPRAVVVTRGAAGTTWFAAAGAVTGPAEAVAVVDTVGAGDTVSAAVIDALWDDPDRDPPSVLAHAARAAAVTVSRAGADPPYRRELETGPRGLP